MNPIDALREQGGTLLGIATILLSLGVVGVVLARRSPVVRQRIAEGTVAVTLIWMLLALLPLPRFEWTSPTAEVSPPVAAPGTEGGTPAPRENARPRVATPTPTPTSPESIRLETAAAAAPTRPSTVAGGLPLVESLLVESPLVESPLVESSRIERRLTESAAPATATAIDFRSRLVRLYLIGAGLALVWIVLGGFRLWRVLRRRVPTPRWLDDELGRIVGDSESAPALIVTRARVHPFCLRWPRAIVVVPAHLCVPGTADLLRQVLGHEWVHLRRRDGRGRALFAAALPLLYLHPLYWWLRRRARLMAEVIADDGAARSAGRREYARQMIRLAELGRPAALAPLGTVAMFETKSEFFRRIDMLLRQENPLADRCSRRGRVTLWTASTTALALAVGLFGVRPAAAQEDPSAAASANQIRALESEIAVLQNDRQVLEAEIEMLRTSVRELMTALRAAQSTPDADASATLRDRVDATLAAKERDRFDASPHPEVAVREGDTLAVIAERAYGDRRMVDWILALNPTLDPSRLRVGQRVRLPLVEDPVRGAAVTPNDPFGSTKNRARNPLVARGMTVPTESSDPRPMTSLIATVSDRGALDLVTRLIDLTGEIEIAELRCAQAAEMREEKAISEIEYRTRQVELETLVRKRDMTRALLDTEIMAVEGQLDLAKAELERGHQLAEKGFISQSEIDASERELRLLQAQLEFLVRAR